MRLQAALAAFAAFLAFPVAGQQSGEKTATETVVVPGWPGSGGNREIRIGGQEIAASAATGPEFSVTAQIVQWEEGRSITVSLPSGETRVVPIPSNMIFPPDLRPGGNVTFIVRQTEDGRFRVTGLTTGMTSVPPYFGQAPQEPPPPPAAEPVPGTVSTPPATVQPGPPPPKGKAVVGASFMTVSGTVKALEKGTSITITDKNGRDRTLALAKGTVLPDGLAVGDAVTARVPLQRPFDGKTVDKVEKPKANKAPPSSSLDSARTPKN